MMHQTGKQTGDADLRERKEKVKAEKNGKTELK